MLKHKSVLRDVEWSRTKRAREERPKENQIFANEEHEMKKSKGKICIFFAKRLRDFVGALCAFSILFPTIQRTNTRAHPDRL